MLLAVGLLSTLFVAYFFIERPPRLDRVSLCPQDGPKGVTVVLIDATDELRDITRREVTAHLRDVVRELPEYHLLDIRVLDPATGASRSIIARCNPGDGTGVSEWTDNPQLRRRRWLELFEQPLTTAINESLAPAKANNSPIMAAIQGIAVDRFTGAAVASLPKRLVLVSDMIENTKDYTQYGNMDLSFERFRRSSAYLKLRTDLQQATVRIKLVERLSRKVDSGKLIQFWLEWIKDSRGQFEGSDRLQGAG